MMPPGSTVFAFVEADELGKTDAADRQLIRSHCMLGKNKKKPSGSKPERKGAAKPRKRMNEPPGIPKGRHTVLQEDPSYSETAYLVPPPAPGDLNIPKFAFDIDHRSRDELFKFYHMSKEHTFSLERCVEFNFNRALWFQWLIEDCVFLQLTVAYASVVQDLYLYHQSLSRRTFGEMSKTIILLNTHLSDAAFCQRDSTLLVVLGLTAMSDFMGDSGAVATHLVGLGHLLKLRGGLHGLRHNLRLYLKICIMDLAVSLTSGAPPPFGRGPVSWAPIFHKNIPPLLSHDCGDAACSLVAVSSLGDPRLVAVFCDLQHQARLMNAAALQPASKRISDAEYIDTLASIEYRLLKLQGTQVDVLAEGLRLAMLCYLVTAFNAPGKRPAFHDLKKRLTESCAAIVATPETQDLLLWILVFGGITVFEGNEPWLLDKWMAVVPADSNWPGLRRRLQIIIWVNVLHDDMGEQMLTFFESIRQTSKMSSIYNPWTDSSSCESANHYQMDMMMLPAVVRRDRFRVAKNRLVAHSPPC